MGNRLKAFDSDGAISVHGAREHNLKNLSLEIPRNRFVGSPIHRVDMRLQQRISLGGRRSVDGIFEVFNLFDRANYGSFTTNVDSTAFGQPSQNTNIAYSPLSVQLGFRLAF